MAMRPALAAVLEQQKMLDQTQQALRESQQVIAALFKADQRKTAQIAQLTRGLAAVARLTGTDTQVRTAIFKRADEQNPAQPVPSPAPEAPYATTADAETPEAHADVRAPGLVPGTNNDTAADATTTTYTPGLDLDSPALNNLIDVTRPVDGTQGPRPLGETKTLVDVRVGDPMNSQVAFPVNGPYANAQRTSSVQDSGLRSVAALKLARLRISLGMAESDDDLVLMESIVRDASLSEDMIQREITSLEKASAGVQARTAAQVEAPRNLVPRSAAVRTMPAMNKTSRNELSAQDADAEDIFLGSF
jgi:hypothetical protein